MEGEESAERRNERATDSPFSSTDQCLAHVELASARCATSVLHDRSPVSFPPQNDRRASNAPIRQFPVVGVDQSVIEVQEAREGH